MKRKRKQPRRLTPPLILRDSDGERECIEVDQEHTTTRTMMSGRVRAYLILSGDLRITLGSRCVNKQRVPVINVTAIPAPIHRPEPVAHDITLQEGIDFLAGAGMQVITLGFDEPTQEGGE